MIQTASHAAVFGLILFALFLVGAAVFRKAIEKCAGALRVWLG